MFGNFYNVMKSAAENIRDIEFLRVIIPVLAVAGPVLFFYQGVKGIVKKKTIKLFRNSMDHSLKPAQINGVWAIIIGFIYIISGAITAIILIPFAWALVFG